MLLYNYAIIHLTYVLLYICSVSIFPFSKQNFHEHAMNNHFFGHTYRSLISRSKHRHIFKGFDEYWQIFQKSYSNLISFLQWIKVVIFLNTRLDLIFCLLEYFIMHIILVISFFLNCVLCPFKNLYIWEFLFLCLTTLYLLIYVATIF